MEIKVCGIADPQSAAELNSLPIRYLGLIFVESSPRFVTRERALEIKGGAPDKEWVGVFVDKEVSEIVEIVSALGLSVVQLHGSENSETIAQLRSALSPDVKIWNVISLARDQDITQEFDETSLDAILFDTKSASGASGGTGEKFDWSVLEKTHFSKPVILSGGIGPDDVDTIHSISARVPKISIIDINSRFETAPGRKDSALVKRFVEEVLS